MAKGVNLIFAFGSAIVELAKAALGWGNNIGDNFASGILSAAQEVVAALQQLGSIIASWLSPGSPPKITPQLDKWGADAATVYMQGWTKGDFSGLQELGNMVEGVLKGLVDTGGMKKGAMLEILIGSQANFAQGIDEVNKLGDISKGTFDKIITGLGPVGGKMQGAIRAFFDLKKATADLERAQQDLNDVTAKYDAILTPLNAQMKILQDKAQAIRDNQRLAELQKQLADGSLSQADAELALNEIEQIKLNQQIAGIETARDTDVAAAQTRVDAAQTTVDAAQKQYDAQQGLIAAQNSQNALIKEQTDALKGAAGGAAAAAGGMSSIGTAIDGIKAPMTDIKTAVEDAKQKFTDFKMGVTDALDNVKAKATDTFTQAGNAINTFMPVLVGLGAAVLTFVWLVTIPAFIAWATAAWAVAAANIAAMAPIVLAMLAVGVVVGLLYYAWQTNFLGMRDILTDVWNNYLYPAFIAIKDWLSHYIPIAVQAAADFWNNILKPALTAVWDFIVTKVVPVFNTVVTWLKTNIPKAVQATADFWNNTLKPALNAVWYFLTTYVVPIFKALVNVHIAAISLSVRLLSALFTNVLVPAFNKAWDFVAKYLTPVLTWLYDTVINKGLKPAFQSVAFFILGTLIPQFGAIKLSVSSTLGPALDTAKGIIKDVAGAFHDIDSAIKNTIKWIQSVADKLNSISIPSWLQGHSPPPMAHWFDYISEAMQGATNQSDAFNKALQSSVMQSNIGATNANTSGAADDRANMHITINRSQEDPRTTRDELRMQAKMWNMNPVG